MGFTGAAVSFDYDEMLGLYDAEQRFTKLAIHEIVDPVPDYGIEALEQKITPLFRPDIELGSFVEKTLGHLNKVGFLNINEDHQRELDTVIDNMHRTSKARPIRRRR